MSAESFDLPTLLQPLDQATFFATYREQQPYILSRHTSIRT